jgi:AcrR family transcriptional regulator
MNRQATLETSAERRGRADGRRSRDAILDAAARLATLDGLEGLSIAGLAELTGMSKSGLYAHFGSKEHLQLATVERARAIFEREVLTPARSRGDGLCRLRALAGEFLAYLGRDVFPGGCFFAAVGAEFDTHPGRVKERIVAFTEDWRRELLAAATRAQRDAEITAEADPEQLVFEVNALLLMAHASHTMFADPACLERAAQGLERLLGGEAGLTPAGCHRFAGSERAYAVPSSTHKPS